MSYIQIDIGPERVIKEGEPATSKRGLKFNQLAVELYTKKVDWEHHTDASEVYATFYAGLMGNCAVKQEEPDFTFEQVCDWVDDISVEEKKSVMAVFADSKKFKEWIERVNNKLEEQKNQEGEPIKKNET